MITAYPTSRAAGGGDICNTKRSVFREVSELWIGWTHLRPPVTLRTATGTTKTPGRKAQRPGLRMVPTAASQRPLFVIGSSQTNSLASKMGAAPDQSQNCPANQRFIDGKPCRGR